MEEKNNSQINQSWNKKYIAVLVFFVVQIAFYFFMTNYFS